MIKNILQNKLQNIQQDTPVIEKKLYLLLMQFFILLTPLLYSFMGQLFTPLFFLALVLFSWMGMQLPQDRLTIRYQKPIRRTYFILAVYMVLQIIPVPSAILRYLSPGTYYVLDNFRESVPLLHPVSVVPSETLILLAQLVALGLFFRTMKIIKLEKQEIISMLNMLVLSAVILMFLGFGGLLPAETGRQSCFFSFYLAVLFPLAPSLLMAHMRYLESTRGLIEKIFSLISNDLQLLAYIAVSGILGIGVLYTRNRPALAAAVLACFFIGAWIYYFKRPQAIRRNLKKLLVPLQVVALLIGLNTGYGDMKKSHNGHTPEIVRWRQTYSVIRAFPITGAGFANWEYAVSLYDGLYDEQWPLHLHSGYLELAAEGGAAGGLIVVVLMGLLYWSLILKWWRRRHPQVKTICLGITASLGAIFYLFAFNTALRAPPLLFAFALLLVLGFKMGAYKTARRADPQTRRADPKTRRAAPKSVTKTDGNKRKQTETDK